MALQFGKRKNYDWFRKRKEQQNSYYTFVISRAF